MDKEQLRRQIQMQKRGMTPRQMEQTSLVLTQKLLSHPAYLEAESIFGYYPVNQEVRLLPVLAGALAEGKRVALPKVENGQMRFFRVEDLTRLSPGFGGIPEPEGCECADWDETAFILTPGLAFDLQGHRCGYGGGFYDRYLTLHPHHPTLALCYGFQLVPFLPTEACDRPVDTVLFAEVTT